MRLPQVERDPRVEHQPVPPLARAGAGQGTFPVGHDVVARERIFTMTDRPTPPTTALVAPVRH